MITIYHNPRCSKSRQTLELLQTYGEPVQIVHYLSDPPDAKSISSLAKQLNVHPTEFIRKGEKVFKELGLSLDDDRTIQQWCQIMAENPILIERPIVVRDNKAVIGRPPENVTALFAD